jgi:hypothetical protein
MAEKFPSLRQPLSMSLGRRRLLGGALASGALAGIPRALWASTRLEDRDTSKRSRGRRSDTRIAISGRRASGVRDLAVAHQRREDGRGQRLGDRGKLEHRVDVNGLGLACLAHAERVEEDDFIAMDDGDRKAGHELLVDDLPREFIELSATRP